MIAAPESELLDARRAEEADGCRSWSRRRRSRARARSRARGSGTAARRRVRARRCSTRRTASAARRSTSRRASSDDAGGGAHDRVLVGLGPRELARRRGPRTARRCGRPCRAPPAARTRSSARRRPAAASSESRRCTSAFVPTSMPRVGSSTISSVGLRASHFASTTFCWLPPESVQTGFVSRPYLSCSRSAQSRREPPLGAARDQPAAPDAVERRERDVALDREVHHQPLLAAVLGDEPDARRPSPRSASRAAAAGRRSRPSRRPSGRCRRSPARPRVRPAPTRPARATISPLRTSNETSVKTPSRVSRSTFSTTWPGSVGTFGNSASMSRPTIARITDCDRQLLDRLGQDVAAVAHHGDALAEREDLLEPVRDEEHRGSRAPAASRRCRTAARPRCVVSAAVGSSITITRAFVVSAFAISTSCWSAIERPRASRSGSSRTPSWSNTAARLAAHPPAVDAAEALERLRADEDVLGDAEVGKERRLLEDDRDPGRLRLLGVVEDRLLAVEQEPAGVGPVDAGEDLDERRLAGAVLADEPVHLAGEELRCRRPRARARRRSSSWRARGRAPGRIALSSRWS